MKRFRWPHLPLAAALAVFLVGCSVEKPVAPKWETKVAVPLIDKTFTIRELVEDEENVFFNGDSVLSFSVEKSLDAYHVGERLKISRLEKIASAKMGNFRVDSPDTVSAWFTLAGLWPGGGSVPPGQSVSIPPFQFETEAKALGALTSLGYVELESGVMEVTIENHMPIPLGAPPDYPLQASIWAGTPANRTHLFTVQFEGQIPAFEGRTVPVDVSGLRIPRQLSVVVSGGSPGSGGNPVPVGPETGFEVGVFLRDLRVKEAVAKVPAQEIRTQASFHVRDTLAIVQGRIKRGSISLDFESALPVSADLSYQLPNFRRSGSGLQGQLHLSPQGFYQEGIDLSGVEIVAAPGSTPGEQELRFEWVFRTEDTGNNMVFLRASDSVFARLTVDEIVLSEVHGEIGKVRVNIEPMVRSVKVPKHIDSLEFDEVTLDLALEHTLEFPAHAQIVIEGSREDGRVAELVLDPELHPAPQNGSRVDHFVIDQSYPGLREWMRLVPSSILVRGYVEVGSPGVVATISEYDWVQGTMKISAPFSVRIPEQTTRGSVDSLKSSAEDRKETLDYVKGVHLVAEIENSLQFGGSITLKFARDTSLVYRQPSVSIGPIGIDPARRVNGILQPSRRTVEIALDEQQLDFFRYDPVYSGVEVHFPGTGSESAVIRASDYLQVRAYLETRLLVHERDSSH
ncbi:MAG: hypothetical protein ONB23_10690 [candidate division KSB1 bacterium]|nr:hypothetical protein [candidate division KSB1 bacterium]